jgi:hypothetical protein
VRHYFIKLGGRDDSPVARRQYPCDFLLHILHALRQRRIAAEDLRGSVLGSWSLWPGALEESNVAFRIVAGLVEVLEPEEIRRELGVPTVFQIGDRNREI